MNIGPLYLHYSPMKMRTDDLQCRDIGIVLFEKLNIFYFHWHIAGGKKPWFRPRCLEICNLKFRFYSK